MSAPKPLTVERLNALAAGWVDSRVGLTALAELLEVVPQLLSTALAAHRVRTEARDTGAGYEVSYGALDALGAVLEGRQP